MKVLAVLLALACTALYVQAQNVICGKGTTTKTVTVEDKKSYTFKTQKGKKYKGNTDCTAEYVMGDTCAKMSFSCTKFNTNNKDKKKCAKGDKVTVTANGKSKAYCKTKKPKVTSTGDITVVFTSDKKKSGTGAVCKVKCTEAATETTTSGGGTGSTNGTTTNGTKVVWPLLTSPVPSKFSKYTTVFGVGVLGHSSVSDVKFQHVASVLASWLDNDQDGCVDNPLVLTKMLGASPKPIFLAAGPSEPSNSAVEAIINKGMEPAALVFNNELLPNCAGPAADNECADATLEEVLHMVTDKGYAKAWPETFSPSKTSTLTKAMDVARGGKFTTIPSPYPSSAWYTYNDQTCTYQCMATEYIYWGVCSWVGALDKRTGVTNEWKFNTKAKLVAGDALMTAIIKDTSVYKLPNISPTGIYSGASTCSSGANHS